VDEFSRRVADIVRHSKEVLSDLLRESDFGWVRFEPGSTELFEQCDCGLEIPLAFRGREEISPIAREEPRKSLFLR
jgi:hypothetical protein